MECCTLSVFVTNIGNWIVAVRVIALFDGVATKESDGKGLGRGIRDFLGHGKERHPGKRRSGEAGLADLPSLAHYEFDPYGNTTVATGTHAAANLFRFSTMYCRTNREFSATVQAFCGRPLVE
jgi:hypothetical protein